ncbi:tail fiber/spike domain-containing protein [Enterobacter hormaechei]|uniref:tail fiber/spike domain-containing protein n=1 Tax=Enterobacter hormaechei TaxID=158836 RepID=UPI00079A92B3|nr:hypothetical protein [Enterobacter hormaechei]CZX07333.1 T7 tail fiber protein [Enterobacter hormaechei]
MATTPTNLPVPSESPRDLKFNAGKIDEFVTSMGWTYTDRFGNKHYTIEGLRWLAQQAISAFGYITLDSFEDGNNLTLPNQVLRLEATGEYYRWDGALPKSVPAGSTPLTTGGIGPGAWLSVGDAVLRTQISDPDGANKYPELQISRWRDDLDVRGWGVFPDGTDVTAKLCAALDYANGDYSQLVEYGKNRKTIYVPPGDYVVDMTKLTGIHASAGRFVIRCNVDCVGRIPNGDFLVAHVRSINVSGLSGKSLTIRGFQFCNFVNIDFSGDITLMGSQSFTLPGLINWGGGSYWNSFSRVRAGTTSGGGRFVIDISDSSVNQNTIEQLVAAGVLITGSGSGPSFNYEGNSNIFNGVDVSGTQGYMLDNSATPPQRNTVIGLYGEVNGNGFVRGPWTILGARAQYSSWVSTIDHMSHLIGTDATSGNQGGDTLSISGNNLCPSGDWSLLDGVLGAPFDYQLQLIPSEAIVKTDVTEPSGCGRAFGVTNASAQCKIVANLTRANTDFIRGAFYWWGDAPLQIALEAQDNTNQVFFQVSKYYGMSHGGWRLYRVSAPTNDWTKAYRLAVTVAVGKSGYLGGSVFSSYQASLLPTFCGWRHVRVLSSGKPTITNTSGFVNGMVANRTSTPSYPADPAVMWVWNGTTWLTLNASA